MPWESYPGRIDPYFDSVICGDMVKKAKPDPEIYQKASESLGIQPENCMAFEDAPGGILSAHQAGMRVIMVPDLVQPTGGDMETYVSGL